MVKDPEFRAKILQREEQKLERIKKMGKQLKVIKDEHRKNEWKLAERSRPFEPFDDDTIVQTEIIRDQFAADVAKVYNEQDAKYKRRVERSRAACAALEQLAPHLIPAPFIEDEMISFSGPSYSLPIDDFLEMRAPMGNCEKNGTVFHGSD